MLTFLFMTCYPTKTVAKKQISAFEVTGTFILYKKRHNSSIHTKYKL